MTLWEKIYAMTKAFKFVYHQVKGKKSIGKLTEKNTQKR